MDDPTERTTEMNIDRLSLEDILMLALEDNLDVEMFRDTLDNTFVVVLRTENEDGYFGYDPDTVLFAARQAYATYKEQPLPEPKFSEDLLDVGRYIPPETVPEF